MDCMPEAKLVSESEGLQMVCVFILVYNITDGYVWIFDFFRQVFRCFSSFGTLFIENNGRSQYVLEA